MTAAPFYKLRNSRSTAPFQNKEYSISFGLGHAKSCKRHELKANTFTLWSGTPTHQTHVDQKFLLSSVNVTLTVKRPMSSLNLLESYLNVVIVGEVTKAVAEEVDETLDTGHQPALWAICLGGHSPTPSEKTIYWQWDGSGIISAP